MIFIPSHYIQICHKIQICALNKREMNTLNYDGAISSPLGLFTHLYVLSFESNTQDRIFEESLS